MPMWHKPHTSVPCLSSVHTQMYLTIDPFHPLTHVIALIHICKAFVKYRYITGKSFNIIKTTSNLLCIKNNNIYQRLSICHASCKFKSLQGSIFSIFVALLWTFSWVHLSSMYIICQNRNKTSPVSIIRTDRRVFLPKLLALYNTFMPWIIIRTIRETELYKRIQ